MNTYSNKIKKNESADPAPSQSAGRSHAFQMQDNRQKAAAQKKQVEAMAGGKPVQQKANDTGLPDQLKTGIENLSGHSMDDVKVHYNSAKPAQLNAHAYAQGTDIHIAPGQEKHLPHEAWHVVQQKQGRVQPTMQMKGKVNVNDDKGLEKEADVMGANAATQQYDESTAHKHHNNGYRPVVQRVLRIAGTPVTPEMINNKGHYKTKLNSVLSEEAPKAFCSPVNVRSELTRMALEGANTYAYDTRREAVLGAIGKLKGVVGPERTLSAAMDRIGGPFTGFPKSETWRLLMDGKHQQKRGKYGFENEKGYMAALMTAYTHMLDHLPDQLTAELYEQLHDYAIHNVKDRHGEDMQQGFRDNMLTKMGFGVDSDTWSLAGYNELVAKYRNRRENAVGTALSSPPDEMVGPGMEKKVFAVKAMARTQCVRFANQVLDDYRAELATAVNADDRLLAIARCCQDLDQLHLFFDGNIRTVAFLILNKLLLQNALTPVIMNEPNIFDCKSVAELREAIKQGQAKFQSYRR